MKSTVGSSGTYGRSRTGILLSSLSLLIVSCMLFRTPANYAPPVIPATAPSPTPTKTPVPWYGRAKPVDGMLSGTVSLPCVLYIKSEKSVRVYRPTVGPIWLTTSGCFSDYEDVCRGCICVECPTNDCTPCTRWIVSPSVVHNYGVVMHLSSADYARLQPSSGIESQYIEVYYDVY